MPSRKQEIYCRLLYQGFIHLRLLCGRGAHATAEDMLGLQHEFELGWEQANFLHHVHNSILEPDYTENDIGFINFAIPCHIARLGDRLGNHIAALMIEFYEGVPEARRGELTWHPSEALRQLAAGT